MQEMRRLISCIRNWMHLSMNTQPNIGPTLWSRISSQVLARKLTGARHLNSKWSVFILNIMSPGKEFYFSTMM